MKPRAVVLGAVAVLGVVLLIWVAIWWDRQERNVSRSSLEAAWLIDTATGPAVLADEQYEYSRTDDRFDGYALSLVDATTGKTIARTKTPFGLRYVGRADTALWFEQHAEDNGLHRRDPTTLAVTTTERQWRANNPSVSGEIHVIGGVTRGAIAFQDDQANHFWLDVETLVARAADPPPTWDTTARVVDLLDDASTDTRVRGLAGLTEGDRRGLHCTGHAASKLTLLRAELLQLAGDDTGRWLESPDGAIAVYRESLADTAGWLLARVPCEGDAVWTMPLPGSPEGAAIVGGTLVVIAVADGGDTAIAIDLATGAERWRHAY